MKRFFCALAAWLLACAVTRGAPSGFVLEIEMANPKGGVVQVFYNTGYGYNQHDSATLSLPPSEQLQPLRFPIPAAPIKHLRIDPDIGEATIRIGQIKLLTDDGKLLHAFGPEHLRPMYDIASFVVTNGVATIHTGKRDPMLLSDEPLHALTHQVLGRRTLHAPEILALGALVALLLALALVAAIRAVIAPGASQSRGRFARLTRHGPWLAFAGAFLMVAGGRLFWLWRASRPMPFWDEWESDALYLLMPLRGGFLDWQALVIPQSEHRIVITRLITLVGTLLNGEWDPRLGMVAGALMFAASIALAATLLWRAGRVVGTIAVLLLVAATALPFDYNNLLWGGQSQMYALNFLAICCLAIGATGRFDTVTWIGAAAAGFLSLVTMGAGFVAPGIAAAVCVVRWFFERQHRRSLALLGVIFLAATVAGLLWREASHWHEPSYAHTFAEFWRAFGFYAAWPLPGHGLSLLVMWLPWVLVGWRVLQRHQAGPLEWFALATGAWALVTAVGLAHGRPHDLPPIDSKYFAALSVGGLAAVLSTAALLRDSARRGWSKAIAAGAALAIAIAMIAAGIRGIQGAQFQRELKNIHDDLVRHYLATGDRASMQDVAPERSPYWNSAELAERLDSPLLQPLLPAPLRQSLNQRPGVHLPTEPGPLTLTARTLMKCSVAFLALGAVLVALGFSRRENPSDASR